MTPSIRHADRQRRARPVGRPLALAAALLIFSGAPGCASEAPDSADRHAASSAHAATAVDLAVSVTDRPDPVASGDPVEFVATVQHRGGNFDAQDVVLTGSWNADTATFVAARLALNGTSTGSCDSAGPGLVRCALDPGAGYAFGSQLVAYVDVVTTRVGVIASTWTVDHAAERDTQNNTVQETTAVFAELETTDLYISAVDTPDPATVTQPLAYAVRVGNNGAAHATGATATIALDETTDFVAVDRPECGYQAGQHHVVCTFAALAVAHSETVNVQVTPTVGGIEVTSVARVTGPALVDSQPANNVAVATTSVLDYLVDLGVTIDAARWVAPSGDLDYAVVVTNHAATPRHASGVTATIDLPAGYIVEQLPPTCEQLLNQVTCVIGDLAAGAQTGLSIAGRTTLCADHVAEATAAAIQGDYEPSNDTRSALTRCVDCDDRASCTTDTLDPTTGGCSHVADPATNCGDDDLCTADICDAQNNCANPAAVSCPNQAGTDRCAAREACEPETGACVIAREAVTCDDGVDCTQDSCQAGVCRFTPVNAACDDGLTCTEDSCSLVAQGCVHEVQHARCDDANVCNGQELCDPAAGAGGTGCLAGIDLDCDDGVACTIDSCDAAEGCTSAADDTRCDDANPCTTGLCVGNDGGDADGCTFSGTPNNGQACDDGSHCTENNLCQEGACSDGTPVNCDDGKSCTEDSCEPTTGCVNATAACSDGDPCNGHEACDANGQCVGGQAPDCDDGDPCTVDRCDGTSGACVHTPTANLPCDDGDACTAADVCDAAGACGGTPVTCPNDDRSDRCASTYTCNPSDGLCHVAQGDAFAGCDDGNACTTDGCDSATGCTTENVDCDDHNACTGVETCDVTTGCVGGEAIDCDDNNPCTVDTCDPVSGACGHTIATGLACDDGLHCTSVDRCDAEGTCRGEAVPCDNEDGANGCADRYACTEAAQGCERIYAFPGCDDGDACTQEQCDPLTPQGCEVSDVICSDGDVCNGLETCDSATGCNDGQPLDCDDQNPCTVDSCDPELGCQHSPIDPMAALATTCDDGDACTVVDRCGADGTCSGTAVRCLNEDGSNQCLGQYTCEEGACVEVRAPASCDDESACTDDSCDPNVEGGCVHAPTVCDDGIDCTVDSCDDATGCVATADDSRCEDTGNICTTPVCNELLGCIVDFADGEACDDASGCTTEDTCLAGLCVGTLDPNCSQCTVTDCDPATGECTEQPVADGHPCVNPDGISCPTTCLEHFIDGTVIAYELPETSSMDPQVTVEWLVDHTSVTYNLHPEHTLDIRNDGSIFIGTPATFGADGRLEHPAADDEDLYAQLYVECTAVTPALFDANGDPRPDTGYNALDENGTMCWIDEAEILFPGTPGTFPQQPCAELVTPRIERTAEYHIEGARICIEMVLYVNQAGAITSEDGSCGDAEAMVTITTCLDPISCSPASCEGGTCQPSDMCVVETECIEVLIDDEVPGDVPEDFSALIHNCITADCTQDCAASLEDNPECQVTCITSTTTEACGHLIDDAVELQECVTVTSDAQCDAYCAQIGDPDPSCRAQCRAEICIDNMTYLAAAGTPIARQMFADCAQVRCEYAQQEGGEPGDTVGDDSGKGDGNGGGNGEVCETSCFSKCVELDYAAEGGGGKERWKTIELCTGLCDGGIPPEELCTSNGVLNLGEVWTHLDYAYCIDLACHLDDTPEAAACRDTTSVSECLASNPTGGSLVECVQVKQTADCDYACDGDLACMAQCTAAVCADANAAVNGTSGPVADATAHACITLGCEVAAGGDEIAAARCGICYDVLVTASFLPDDVVLQNCLDTDDPPGGQCADPADPCCQVCTGDDGNGDPYAPRSYVQCPPELCEEQPQCFTACSDASSALLAEGADGDQVQRAFQLCLDTCTACPEGLETCEDPPFCVPSETRPCVTVDPCEVDGEVAACLCTAKVDTGDAGTADFGAACEPKDCAHICALEREAGILPSSADCERICNEAPLPECVAFCGELLGSGEGASTEDAAKCVAGCLDGDPLDLCDRLPKNERLRCIDSVCQTSGEAAVCAVADCFESERAADLHACVSTRCDAQCAGLAGSEGDDCRAQCQADVCNAADTRAANAVTEGYRGSSTFCLDAYCAGDADDCRACVRSAAIAYQAATDGEDLTAGEQTLLRQKNQADYERCHDDFDLPESPAGGAE